MCVMISTTFTSVTQIFPRLVLNHTALISVFTPPWTERDKTNAGAGGQERRDAKREIVHLI